MNTRRPNHRIVKLHRTYSVEEISNLFGTHKNTVRTWLKAGLQTCDQKRPVLVLGSDLASFLRSRRASKKQPCKRGELYCVRCRAPKRPGGEMVEYLPQTQAVGVLRGICPDCYCMMNRRVSHSHVEDVCGDLAVSITQGLHQVSDRNELSLNSDFRKDE